LEVGNHETTCRHAHVMPKPKCVEICADLLQWIEDGMVI